MTTIRPFAMDMRPGNEHHRAGVDAVFRTNRTLLNPRFLHEPTATIASEIYCHVYHITRMPSFVLENGAGSIVGYIFGTHSTPEFTRRIPYLTKWLLQRLEPDGILAPPNYLGLGMAEPSPDDGNDLGRYLLHMAVRRPNALFGAQIRELWHKWPAHVQINILPEYQRQGWGRALMENFVGELVKENENCRGMHLAVHAGNRDAEGFFRALGFERYQGVLDGGASGEFGRTGGGNPMLYLVKELW
jgi:GNAT superfamily N-acetyltransferase